MSKIGQLKDNLEVRTYNYSHLRKEAVSAALEGMKGSGCIGLRTHLSKGIDKFLEALIKHISNGDEVRINRLGTFYQTEVKRTTKFISPLDGVDYGVSKSHRIGFRASKTLK